MALSPRRLRATIAVMQKSKQKDQSGNPLHPGGDDPRHAPESGEPSEISQFHGKPIDELTGKSEPRREKSDRKSDKRGSK